MNSEIGLREEVGCSVLCGLLDCPVGQESLGGLKLENQERRDSEMMQCSGL